MNKENKITQQTIMNVFMRVSSWIALPVIIGAFVGKYLDMKYGTGNLWLLTVIGFSFLISMVGIVKETNKKFKELQNTKENKYDKN